MSQQQIPGYAPQPVSTHAPEVRSRFMKRVYARLALGIAAFIAIEVYLFSEASGYLAYEIANALLGPSWLLVLGGFMLVSWLGTSFAWKAQSAAMQYGGYALMIAVYAVIFTLPLAIAASEPQLDGVISTAAWITALGFAGLTGIALTTSKDFKFLRGLLVWAGMLALGAIVVAVLVPSVQLGAWFSIAMIGLAGGAILYDTQKIYHSYPPDREVAAAMSLFASVMLMFWYVLRLLSRR
ncbi:Bax inhibitor-1/YccA family protein [Nitriliruptor alkaliphilus]|uniref:Bax inhibitor-1/YccA family protein n=1 Tax=Nitriliruptor alkaliphilus TaxID=427918 RepID=UPI0006973B2A|nr:Bax inhibitor-1 family protein [Nitriliruptor alkaliphilus]